MQRSLEKTPKAPAKFSAQITRSSQVPQTAEPHSGAEAWVLALVVFFRPHAVIHRMTFVHAKSFSGAKVGERYRNHPTWQFSAAEGSGHGALMKGQHGRSAYARIMLSPRTRKLASALTQKSFFAEWTWCLAFFAASDVVCFCSPTPCPALFTAMVAGFWFSLCE
jgi:hypothetical protein